MAEIPLEPHEARLRLSAGILRDDWHLMQ